MVQHEFYGEQTVFKREQNDLISAEENTDHIDEKPNENLIQKEVKYRVGYWLPDKTLTLTDWDKFIELCKSNKIELIKLDLDSDLERGLPYHLFLHKIIALYKPKLRGHGNEVQFDKLLTFINNHPEIPLIDVVDPQLSLFNREFVCTLIEQVCRDIEKVSDKQKTEIDVDCNFKMKTVSSSDILAIPKWFRFDSAPTSSQEAEKDGELQFPCICKCLDTWDTRSHEMSIVFSWKQLSDTSIRYPIILQNFVRHQKVLFKVYVIGDEIIVQRRPSVDIPEDHSEETGLIHFNGHKLSKRDTLSEEESEQLQSPEVNSDLIASAVSHIRSRVNLNIFGVDFLVATADSPIVNSRPLGDSTGNVKTTSSGGNVHYLVDINPFPGCSSLPEFHPLLLKLLLSKLSNAEP